MYSIITKTSSAPTYVDKNGNRLSGRWKKTDKSTPASEIILETSCSLYSIAVKYYGSPLYFQLIADFNDILDPDLLLEGGRAIRLPIIK